MIKGPDILIDTLIKIKKSTKIFVLLLGPSRGYVKNELKIILAFFILMRKLF